jgi:VanZ family protein
LAARGADTTDEPDRPGTSGRGHGWTPWIPVAVWLAVIAGLGSAGFEHQQTSRFIGPLLHWLFPDWSDAQVAALHGWIRKGAHLTEYALAAVLIVRALWLTAGVRTRTAAALPTLALVAAMATADEARQSVVDARTGSPRDVALDVAGGAVGLGVAPWIVPWLGVGRRERDDEEARDA